MKDIEYLELGIIEFEKHLEDDPNNEWLKRIIAGMKKCHLYLQSDNSKEAVKCLNFLKEESIDDIACFKNSVTTKTLYQLYFTNFDTIEKQLIKSQEQGKALKIIFKKEVNILLLKLAKNLDEYNERTAPKYELTQEEFDLLKRYF